jgi:replicative DNA helicase
MDTLTTEPRSVYAELLAAERAVIAACLIKPARILEITARITPGNIANKIHERILATLATLAEEGRTPSVEAVVSILGEDEIEAGLSLRKYLLNLSRQAIEGMFLPWEDAVEVVADRARRRQIAGIGGHLAQGADVAIRLGDLIAEAAGMLDEVSASMRSGHRLSYDAGGAGAAAIAHMRGVDEAYPSTGLADLDDFLGGWPRRQLSIGSTWSR